MRRWCHSMPVSVSCTPASGAQTLTDDVRSEHGSCDEDADDKEEDEEEEAADGKPASPFAGADHVLAQRRCGGGGRGAAGGPASTAVPSSADHAPAVVADCCCLTATGVPLSDDMGFHGTAPIDSAPL